MSETETPREIIARVHAERDVRWNELGSGDIADTIIDELEICGFVIASRLSFAPSAMTPEERALQVCAELKGAPYDPDEWIEARAPETLEAITAAIRAAENDALERAAAWHDQQATTEETKAGKSPDQIVARGIRLERAEKHRAHAASIRALKHPDPK